VQSYPECKDYFFRIYSIEHEKYPQVEFIKSKFDFILFSFAYRINSDVKFILKTANGQTHYEI
jgi:hypothetical protein